MFTFVELQITFPYVKSDNITTHRNICTF